MAEWKGKIVTCDRCGAECRCKFLTEDAYDGSFTIANKFEAVQEDWKYHYEIGWLCPSCESTYQRTIENFMTFQRKAGDV